MRAGQNKTEISNLPEDILRLIFTFFSWANLSESAPVSKQWARLVRDQKRFFRDKLLSEKGIRLSFVPRELYEAHPFDPQVLYRKLTSIPRGKIWTSGTTVRLYTAYMLNYAMVDAPAFFAAKERFLIEHPKDGFGDPNRLGPHISKLAAISGSVEVIQSFGDDILDFSLCNRPSDIMEGAIMGNSWELVDWLMEQRDHFKKAIGRAALWAIEYDRPYILQQLETHHDLGEFFVEKHANCLEAAIKSGSIKLVERFVDQANVPTDFLHTIAKFGHVPLFRWAMQHLMLSINAKNDQGLMPIHVAASKGHVDLVHYIAEPGECCLGLVDPKLRADGIESEIERLIFMSYKHMDVLKLLHESFGLSLSVVDDKQQTLLFKSLYCADARRYLVLYSDVDLAHCDSDGNKFYQQPARDHEVWQFYLQNIDTLEFLAKAISGDPDQNQFEAKLVQLSVTRAQDPVVSLALALMYHDDQTLKEHFLRCAFDAYPGRPNQLVELMGETFKMYIPDHAVNLEVIKPDFSAKCTIC